MTETYLASIEVVEVGPHIVPKFDCDLHQTEDARLAHMTVIVAAALKCCKRSINLSVFGIRVVVVQ